MERACTFRRFTAGDVRAILAAGEHAPNLTQPGEPLGLDVPAAPSRGLDAYAPDQLDGVNSTR